MNLVTVLHNKAMEFADEAFLAKMEGDLKTSNALFEKAFELEKEAADAIKDDSKQAESRYILLRSAASLAHACGKYEESRILVDVGLAGNPPAFIIEELNELSEKLNLVINDKVSEVEIIGIITHADAGISEIRLQDIKSKEVLTITVPRHLINEIVKSYWADVVQVKVRKTSSGTVLLDEITKAA